MIQATFIFLMVVLMVMGVYCAIKINGDHPWWVRLIVITPALAANFSVWAMLAWQEVVIYASDCIRAGSIIVIYTMVLFALAGKPLLQIRKNP